MTENFNKIPLFCTFGRGNEFFVRQELSVKLEQDLSISIGEGKLSFQCHKQDFEKITNLKSIERLFYLIKHDSQVSLKLKSDFYNLMKLLENVMNWDEGYSVVSAVPLENEPVAKRPRRDDVSFRVSCRCRGASAKLFDIKRLSRTISSIIQRKTNWIIDMKRPDIEVIIHINNEGTIIGIPFFKKPLADRIYLKHHGLRATTSWILASLADIKPGEVIVDPMCGLGVILIEAAKEWKGARYIGSDKSKAVVKQCKENVDFAQEQNSISVFLANVTNLPLKDNSVDKIVCDLPFGVNHSNLTEVHHLYPRCIQSMNRILKPDGLAVLLTSSDLKDFLIQCCCNKTGSSQVSSPSYENREFTSNIAQSSSASCSDNSGQKGQNDKSSDSSIDKSGHKERNDKSSVSSSDKNIHKEPNNELSNFQINTLKNDFKEKEVQDMLTSGNAEFKTREHNDKEFLANKTFDENLHEGYGVNNPSSEDILHIRTESNRSQLPMESSSLPGASDFHLDKNPSVNSIDCLNQPIEKRTEGSCKASVNLEPGFNTNSLCIELILLSQHYLKLGETHSCACVFKKT